MNVELVAGLVGAFLVVFGLVEFAVRRFGLRRRVNEAESALRAAFDPGQLDRLAGRPSVVGLHEVNRHEDGGPVFVPVVAISLRGDDDPVPAGAYHHVARAVAAIYPVFADDHLSHIDVELRYGGSAFGIGASTVRVAVTPALARLVAEDSEYDAYDLLDDVCDGDDGDDSTPPVAWGAPITYEKDRPHSDSSSGVNAPLSEPNGGT
jgi:hypothetical protein